RHQLYYIGQISRCQRIIIDMICHISKYVQSFVEEHARVAKDLDRYRNYFLLLPVLSSGNVEADQSFILLYLGIPEIVSRERQGVRHSSVRYSAYGKVLGCMVVRHSKRSVRTGDEGMMPQYARFCMPSHRLRNTSVWCYPVGISPTMSPTVHE